MAAGAMLAVCLADAQPRLTKDNIDEVIAAMTLEEKITLLVGGSEPVIFNGVPTGTTKTVPGAAGNTRAIERLGISGTVVADGPAGVRISPVREGDSKTYYATAFPVGVCLASTWNTALVEEVTGAMGNEVKEYGVDVLLAPGMNIHRNILCGRNFEYFSEDPLVSGKMAAAYVNGIQSNGVGTSIKHFCVNNQETNRTENDSRVSRRALREIYLKNFEIAVKESHPWTVMSSYNKLNGKYTQQNRELLTTVLRDEWGYDGIVMTDWGNKAGTVDAVNAGNDLMEPGSQSEIDRIIAGVRDGRIQESQINANVRRMLEYVVRTPRFAGYKYSDNPDLTAHAALARRAAAEGMVLLKNDGVLPLKGTETVALYGTTSYDFIQGGTGSGMVNMKYVRNLKDGLENDGFTVEPTLASWYSKFADYADASLYNNGKVIWERPILPEMEISDKFIYREVSSTDVAVLTIGRNAGEGSDRKVRDGDFTLTAGERQMLQNLCDDYHEAGKKVIVVLNIGGVIETASWKHMPDAILLAWQPGMEGGSAVADVLCGKVNPSGKLATTFPMEFFDTPSARNFPLGNDRKWPSRDSWRKSVERNVDYTEYGEGIYVGYRYFETAGVEVSYPFGYGLSYTSFEYGKPVVKAVDGGFEASVTVRNVGRYAGKEAVQLYVSAPSGGLEKPSCELKAFAKTRELAPGESQTLTMKVDDYSLASFNEDVSEWQTASGRYEVKFASSVKDVRAAGSYQVKKAKAWKVNDVLAPVDKVEEMSLAR